MIGVIMNIRNKVLISLLVLTFLLSPVQFALARTESLYSNSKKHSDNVLHIKFAESDEVSLKEDKFVSNKGNDLSRINEVFNSHKIAKKSSLFTLSPESIKEQRKQLRAKSNTHVPDLNNYYRIVLNQGVDINEVVSTAKSLPNVSEAYAEPLPVKSPVSPNFTSMQTHFAAAPTGMGVSAGSSYPGALGDNVRIADLEYSWNTTHEDISDARQSDTLIANGTPVDPWNDTNHGTAVAGIMNGDSNSYGINGIIPNSKLHFVNTNNAERGWDIPNAINLAQSRLEAGDVMLIEQQTWGPEGRGYMPVEWVAAAYDAIKIATTKGIIVVEAAANGGENLDDPLFGTTFPQGKADSGAILVGAGTACNGTNTHSRLAFSNYGKRVNVQGYGECVTTTGYGNLFSAEGSNAWYTSNFNGTSSASALVAALAGSVSSSYEYQKGTNLTPLQIRDLLAQTGTPQAAGVNSGNIGPLPNLENALKSFSASDTVSPTTPTNLRATLTKQGAASLNWNAASDNSGSVAYRIYRNNILIATTTSTSFSNTSLAKKTSYSYKVQAVDPSGNVSAFSNIVTIKTR
jgi:serine protease